MIQAILGILSGFVSGVMGGAFGVGGAIVTTPAAQVLMGASPIVAVGSTLPVILPTTVAGAQAYRAAEQVDWRAVKWAVPPGLLAAAGGAALTRIVDPTWLLLTTALLIGWQAYRVGVARSPRDSPGHPVRPSRPALILTGTGAGFASGLLGIGGGVVLVPVMAGLLHMPLKRSIGTSLVIIAFMVVPGTLVHALLGHIDWTISLWLSLGVIPGAIIGSRWTLRTRERTLRLVVATFLTFVAVAYGAKEIHDLIAGAH